MPANNYTEVQMAKIMLKIEPLHCLDSLKGDSAFGNEELNRTVELGSNKQEA